MDVPFQELGQQTGVKPNRGWFLPSDPRINREGRPRGSKSAKSSAKSSGCCTAKADRVVRVLLRPSDLAHRLTNQQSAWLVGLPQDVEIIDTFVEGGAVHLVIRSQTFARIGRGMPIPVFQPEFNGLRWRCFDTLNLE